MKRLYDNELIFGRLLTVSRPHLIERYNKALKAFGLPATALESFRRRQDRLLAADRRRTWRSVTISIRTASTGASSS
jgi:hypothetical protein